MSLSRSSKGTLAAILLALSLLGSDHRAIAAPNHLPYDDIAGSFAKDAIVRLTNAKIVSGTGNRKFEPTKAIVRAEFITLVDRLFAIEPVNSAIPAFTDVPKSAWYYKWVQPSVHVGIASGLSPSTFGPYKVVTRQEAAVLIARALKQQLDSSDPNGEPYLDEAEIDHWALPAVVRMRSLGLLGGGDGYFRPTDPMTKAEAAVLLDRVLSRQDWSSQFKAEPASNIRLGWQYNQSTEQFAQHVLKAGINTLSPRWLFLSKTKLLEDATDASLVKWAHKNGKKIWPLVGNRSNPEVTHQLLSNATQREALVQNLTAAVKKHGYDGLNVDFENVSPSTRTSLTLFVSELAQSLHAIKATLSVNVSPDFGTDWTAAFDYAAIGASADYVILMGYDQHWGGSPVAGSVSSLPWLRRGMAQLKMHVPAHKTILGVPLYTRNWTISNAGTKSADWSLPVQNDLVRSLGLKPKWDDELGQYVTSYWRQGVLHKLWLEDGRSLAMKHRLGEDYGVVGYAYWYIGGDSPDVWGSLRNVRKFESCRFA